MLHGFKIVENKNMVDKKQNRTHRKRRINKKWAKRYGFTVTPKEVVFQMGNTLVMHPIMAAALRKKMNTV